MTPETVDVFADIKILDKENSMTIIMMWMLYKKDGMLASKHGHINY